MFQNSKKFWFINVSTENPLQNKVIDASYLEIRLLNQILPFWVSIASM